MKRGLLLPIIEFPFWRQLAWLDIQHRAESRPRRRQEENDRINYCQMFFRFQLSDGCAPFVAFGSGRLVSWDSGESLLLSLREPVQLKVFILLCSYQASAKCLITVTMQRCITVEMQCVFCSLTIWSSRQEVVTTLIVLLISRTTIQELPWLLWGKKKKKGKKTRVLSVFQYSIFFSIYQITWSLFCYGL